MVMQKRLLVDRLLHDSPAARRIHASDHAEAKRQFELAEKTLVRADQMIRGGALGDADTTLNEAMWQIGKARQLVPDPMTRVIEERMRNSQLVDTVGVLRASLARYIERQPAGAHRDEVTARLDRALVLVEEARAFSTAERVQEANGRLDQARLLLLVDLSALLSGETIVYAVRFGSPEEELAWETERNQSFEALIPSAIAQYRPGRDAVNLIDRYVERSRALVGTAKQQAAQKNAAAAVKSVQEATESLQRALRAAGLFVPQQMGSQ